MKKLIVAMVLVFGFTEFIYAQCGLREPFITVGTVTSNSIALSWDDASVGSVIGVTYELSYKLSTSSSWISAAGCGTLSCTVNGLTPATQYNFRVKVSGDCFDRFGDEIPVKSESFKTVATIVLPPPPLISSFSPSSGPIGSVVTIQGVNFNSTATNNVVFFGATKAKVTTATSTRLAVEVPVGSTFQPISVLNTSTHLTGYSARPFITIFRQTGQHLSNNSFSQEVKPGSVPANETIASIAIGDLDGDGKPDLVTASRNASKLSVHRNISAIGSLDASSFASGVDFTTGQGPGSIAIGDLNGDGKPDIVTANGSSASVSVFLNISTPGNITAGSFASKVDFDAGGPIAASVAIGDLDGDGMPDLAVANTGAGLVSVLRNTFSDGNANIFAPRISFFSGNSPQSVAIGDLDGDGRPELVTTNIIINTVSVFKNTAVRGSITAASFAAKVDFITNQNPVTPAIGDLDNDGKPELVVINGSHTSVFDNITSPGSITNGSFAPKVDYIMPGNSSLVVSDLNGDGRLDLTAASSSTFISALENITSETSQTSSFDARVQYTVTNETQFLTAAVGDLDGDGKADLVAIDLRGGSIVLFHNNLINDDFPTPPVISSFSPVAGSVGTSVTIRGDNFGNTRANNIVFFGAVRATVTAATPTFITVDVPAGATFQPISVLNTTSHLTGYSAVPFITTFNPGGTLTSNSFGPKIKLDVASGDFRSVKSADLDDDGKLDLIALNSQSNKLSIFRNISLRGNLNSASFAPAVEVDTKEFPGSLAVGDLNGDGKPDLAVTNGNTFVSVFFNTSFPGNITNSSFARVDFNASNPVHAVAIGDLDGDGKPDLAVGITFNSNPNVGAVLVLRNTFADGASMFAPAGSFVSGLFPTSIAIGDLDGDRKPELAVTDQFNNVVSVFKNVSVRGSTSSTSLSFAEKVDFATTNTPSSVAIGNLNSDQRPELVVTGSSQVSVLDNAGTPGVINSGSFVSAVNYGVSLAFQSLAITDLNGDAKPDLIVAGSVLENTSIVGSSISSFAQRIDYVSVAPSPFVPNFSTVSGDLDNDGRPDLVVSSSLDREIGVFHNNLINNTIPDVFVTSPADNSSGFGTTVTVVAKALAGATTYTLQLSSREDFSSGIIEKSGSRSQVFNGLTYGTRYFARVKTNLSPGFGKTTSFNTIPAEDLAFVISPVNGADDQPTTLDVASNTVPGATQYTIELNTTPDFTGTSIVKTGNRSQRFSALSPNTTYFSRVRTEFTANWGARRSFTTRVASLTNGEIVAYPNPANSQVTLENLEPGSTIKIVDSSSGETVETINAKSEKMTIETAKYKKGIYYIFQGDAGGNKTETRKLIIK